MQAKREQQAVAAAQEQAGVTEKLLGEDDSSNNRAQDMAAFQPVSAAQPPAVTSNGSNPINSSTSERDLFKSPMLLSEKEEEGTAVVEAHDDKEVVYVPPLINTGRD